MGKRASNAKVSTPKKKVKKDEDNTELPSKASEPVLNEIKTSAADGRAAAIKIISWNVAGLRAWIKKDGLDYIKKEDADIVCLQETKCTEKELPGEVLRLKNGSKLTKDNPNDYYMYLYAAEKKGYSGVALWSKKKPIKVKNGMDLPEHDNEGRLITAEYDNFYVVTSYVPNSSAKLVRLDYRRTWNDALQKYINKLNEKKPVIFCGDLNVAHHEIDIANPKSNKRSPGFTIEEREDFTKLLDDGYFDSYRHLNPKQAGAYTYWTYIGNARARNVGWRLDYFVLPTTLEKHLCDSAIRSQIHGSDHCPIVLTLTEWDTPT